MDAEALAAHRALVAMWARLTETIEGARFEPRSDLIVVLSPGVPLPQCNGAWVSEDSSAAVAALPSVLGEIEAAGERPWVQTRSGHERTQAAARRLGLTHTELLPGMVVLPGELADVATVIEIAPIGDAEVGEAIAILSSSFGAPEELLVRVCTAMHAVPETTWYVGRVGGAIVSTALALTLGGATGIFNVATPTQHRRRGYGAALTARAANDGFAAGATFAFLQSSDAGRSVYRQLGFRDVEEYVLLSRPASE